MRETTSTLLRKLREPESGKTYLEQDGLEYLVREYVAGTSLYERVMANGPLEPSQVRAAARSLCQVLDYLHRQSPPVICRDVKPQNVIMDADGCCHLIDLGAARHYRPEGKGDTVFLGTEATAPPEQFGYQQTDQRYLTPLLDCPWLIELGLSQQHQPLVQAQLGQAQFSIWYE